MKWIEYEGALINCSYVREFEKNKYNNTIKFRWGSSKSDVEEEIYEAKSNSELKEKFDELKRFLNNEKGVLRL